MKRIKLKYVTYYDKDYPLLLKEIYHFPYVIFYKGTKQLFNQPHTLAVIGSRKSTSYTTQALEYLFSFISTNSNDYNFWFSIRQIV